MIKLNAIASLFLVISTAIPCCAQTTQPGGQPIAFAYLVAQNRAQRAKIASLVYTITQYIDYSMVDVGKMHAACTYYLKEKGSLRWCERNVSQTSTSAAQAPQKYCVTGALSEHAFCFAWKGLHRATQYLFDSPDKMLPAAVDQARGYCGLSILNYGFGDGDVLLDSHELGDAVVNRWAVNEVHSSHGIIYDMSLFDVSKGEPGQLCGIWTSDPGKGYLITHVRRFTNGGKVDRDVLVDTQLFDGVFLPAVVHETEYLARGNPDGVRLLGLHDSDEPSKVNRLEFKIAALNQPIDDAEFSIRSLHLPDLSFVQQFSKEGEVSSKAIAADQVVDVGLAAKMVIKPRLSGLATHDESGLKVPATGPSTLQK